MRASAIHVTSMIWQYIRSLCHTCTNNLLTLRVIMVQTITTGVPQETILGPLLFALHMYKFLNPKYENKYKNGINKNILLLLYQYILTCH